MTLTRSFVRNAAMTPLDARLMNMATLVCNADGSPRTGVLGGANASIVSALATWHFRVQAAEFACSKGKADGVTLIINNRPDGEDPSAPQSADIEAAARGAGMKYIAIPITHSGFSGPQVDAMIAALDGVLRIGRQAEPIEPARFSTAIRQFALAAAR